MRMRERNKEFPPDVRPTGGKAKRKTGGITDFAF
jgi:hypothetical protein